MNRLLSNKREKLRAKTETDEVLAEDQSPLAVKLTASL
jgi:hypothetical protein